MRDARTPTGRRERANHDKRERIMVCRAGTLRTARRGQGDNPADCRPRRYRDRDLYLYAATKAELLIMVLNRKFATAIDDGLVAAAAVNGRREEVLSLIRPVVTCVSEHVENGRTSLHELVFWDPSLRSSTHASPRRPTCAASTRPSSPTSANRCRRSWPGTLISASTAVLPWVEHGPQGGNEPTGLQAGWLWHRLHLCQRTGHAGGHSLPGWRTSALGTAPSTRSLSPRGRCEEVPHSHGAPDPPAPEGQQPQERRMMSSVARSWIFSPEPSRDRAASTAASAIWLIGCRTVVS